MSDTTVAAPPKKTSASQRPRFVRPDIYWGKSRSGKTTQGVGRAAEYAYERYGKPSRLICAPGEGWENIVHLIDKGIIIPYSIGLARPHPIEDFDKLSKGWWPSDPSDLLDPLVAPGEKGNDPSTIAGWFWEGMSSTSAALMQNTTLRQDIHIPDTPKDSAVKDGQTRWGFSGRMHFYWIQKRIEQWVKASAYLPFPVKAWSSLEAKGESEQKRPVYGPEIIGQAATAQSPAWFNRMIHFSFVSKPQVVDDPTDPAKKAKLTVQVARRLMFLQPHVEENDPYKLECLADLRVPVHLADKVPVVMAPDMKKLYELLDSLQEKGNE